MIKFDKINLGQKYICDLLVPFFKVSELFYLDIIRLDVTTDNNGNREISISTTYMKCELFNITVEMKVEYKSFNYKYNL